MIERWTWGEHLGRRLCGADKEAEPREGPSLSQLAQQGGVELDSELTPSDSLGGGTGVTGSNGYHLAPASYLSESASDM